MYTDREKDAVGCNYYFWIGCQEEEALFFLVKYASLVCILEDNDPGIKREYSYCS